MKKLLYILIITASCFACTSENKPKKKSKPSNESKIVDETVNTVKVDNVVVADDLHKDLQIYILNSFENDKKERVAFISFSDNYALSEHPDSLAIPSVENMKEEDAQRLLLKGKYRKRFLSQMEISESDSIFVYDYATNVLKAVSVKNLALVAHLNIYGADWPYSPEAYMIGFEINPKVLKKSDQYFSHYLAYVGKRSPFVLGGMKAITWKKTAAKNFPSSPINKEDKAQIGKSNKGKTYVHKTEEVHYFVQEYLQENGIDAERLIVIKPKTKEILCDKFFYEDEGASLVPLISDKSILYDKQWKGKLFANKAPVIFGFKYSSFGCPSITVLDPKEKDIYINCDNRH